MFISTIEENWNDYKELYYKLWHLLQWNFLKCFSLEDLKHLIKT